MLIFPPLRLKANFFASPYIFHTIKRNFESTSVKKFSCPQVLNKNNRSSDNIASLFQRKSLKRKVTGLILAVI